MRGLKLKSAFRRVIFWTAIFLVVGIAGLTVLAPAYWKSLSEPSYVPTGKVTEKIMWRAVILQRKATGGIPDLSWGDLRQMTAHQGGFGMEKTAHEEVSLGASLSNGYDTEEDHQEASLIFSTKCESCHGKNGIGGSIGPPLNLPVLKHGDSDLAIYKILRDGIPNTAMVAPTLSLKERWQLVGFIRQMQIHEIGLGENKTPLNIQVRSESLRNNETKPDEWFSYSGTLDGRSYSQLTQITSANASGLKLLWVHEFKNAADVVEATPIVTGGVIFLTVPPSSVVAMDAKTGHLLWSYDRPISAGVPNCCGRVTRGLAVLDNDVFLTTPDGFLVCINANSGRVVWQTQVVRPSQGYSITLAPLIVDRSVVVGVSGREDEAIRGFVTAYQAETGKYLWRFNTVPGPEEPGHETWADLSKVGGGASWVTGSYDPSLGLIYWGVGSPSSNVPVAARANDNLYTDSVIAVHAGTGKLAWYFPIKQHDEHHNDSAQTPILADISIGSSTHKVVCWADRNGFYYVLDRATGKVLASAPFVDLNWDKGLDSNGRPMTAANATTAGGPTRPGMRGARNSVNAAFDPEKGLVFVPALDRPSILANGAPSAPAETPVVRALDVASGAMEWEYFSPPSGNQSYNFSGLLSTRGALVFGASGGILFALDSSTGREVWRAALDADTRAAPISFTVDGSQVVAVSAGRALFLFGL